MVVKINRRFGEATVQSFPDSSSRVLGKRLD